MLQQQTPVINATSLTIQAQGRNVLENVSVAIPRGTISVLLGRTGSGKSALLRSAIGLMRHRSGTLDVLGFNPFFRREACAIRSSSGFVAQNKSAYNNFTVRGMFRFAKAMFPTWQDHLENRLVDRFELPLQQKVRDLSPTNRARLSVSIALAHSPQLLLLDEPFDDVDPGAAHDIMQALVEAVGGGSTVVLATNNPERVENVSDRAYFFEEGRVRLQVSAEDLVSKWRIVQAHFNTEITCLPPMPLTGVECASVGRQSAEWVMSQNSAEAAALLRNLGAPSVQVQPLTLAALSGKLLR